MSKIIIGNKEFIISFWGNFFYQLYYKLWLLGKNKKIFEAKDKLNLKMYIFYNQLHHLLMQNY